MVETTAYLFSMKIVKFPLKETHLLNFKLISWKQATENHFRARRGAKPYFYTTYDSKATRNVVRDVSLAQVS